MKTSSPLLVVLMLAAVLAGTGRAEPPLRPFESDADPAPRGRTDALVFAKLKQLGIPPARGCSDEVFLRRAYLDVIGTLPTAEEAAEFLKDRSAGKRAALVDRREEIVTTLPGEMRIYSTTIPAQDRRPCLMQDPFYRADISRASAGYYQIPTPKVLPGFERRCNAQAKQAVTRWRKERGRESFLLG